MHRRIHRRGGGCTSKGFLPGHRSAVFAAACRSPGPGRDAGPALAGGAVGGRHPAQGRAAPDSPDAFQRPPDFLFFFVCLPERTLEGTHREVGGLGTRHEINKHRPSRSGPSPAVPPCCCRIARKCCTDSAPPPPPLLPLGLLLVRYGRLLTADAEEPLSAEAAPGPRSDGVAGASTACEGPQADCALQWGVPF